VSEKIYTLGSLFDILVILVVIDNPFIRA